MMKPHSSCSSYTDNKEGTTPDRTLGRRNHPASPFLLLADVPTARVLAASPVSSCRNEMRRLALLSTSIPPSPTQVREEAVRSKPQAANRHALPPTPPKVSISLPLWNRRVLTPNHVIPKNQPPMSVVHAHPAKSRGADHPARHFNFDPRRAPYPNKLIPSRSDIVQNPPLAYRAGLGPHLHSIFIDESLRLPPAPIRSVRLVGGYKWIESPTGLPGPTIVVPGVPDVWLERDRPAHLSKRTENWMVTWNTPIVR